MRQPLCSAAWLPQSAHADFQKKLFSLNTPEVRPRYQIRSRLPEMSYCRQL